MLFDEGVMLLFAAVTDCIFVLLTDFCLSVIQEPEIRCSFAYFTVKFKDIRFSHHQKFSCQNQWKPFTAFVANHFLRATHSSGFKILPRFVKVLCFTPLCVKFQPTECNISINFDHFSSSPNYVRGVRCVVFRYEISKIKKKSPNFVEIFSRNGSSFRQTDR